jgi:hypothetical protein
MQASAELLAISVDASRQWWRSILPITLHHLAFARHALGDDAGARALLREALPLQLGLMLRRAIVESLERCAWIAADRPAWAHAAHLFGAAAGIRQEIGAPIPQGDLPHHEPRLRRVSAAASQAEFAAGQRMTIEQAVEYALSRT